MKLSYLAGEVHEDMSKIITQITEFQWVGAAPKEPTEGIESFLSLFQCEICFEDIASDLYSCLFMHLEVVISQIIPKD